LPATSSLISSVFSEERGLWAATVVAHPAHTQGRMMPTPAAHRVPIADAVSGVRQGREGIVASLGSSETRPEFASCDLPLDLPLGNKLPMCRHLGGRGGLHD
jgi:hypothetical protein